MHHAHIRAILEGVIPEVKSSIAAAVEPLRERVAAIEARPIPVDGAPGKDGTSVTIDDVRPLVAEAVGAIPVPQDGKSVTVEDVRPLLDEMVAALPKPENGKDGPPGQSVTLDDVRPILDEMVKSIPVPADGKDGEPGRDGKDAEPVQVEQVMEAIHKFDIAQLLKDALGGQHEIDIVAPDEVAKEMAAAISILAEPIRVKKDVLPVIQSQRPRKMTFERDEQNRIVAAIEE